MRNTSRIATVRYLQLHATLQYALLQRGYPVLAEVQPYELGQTVELRGGKYRVQRVAQQVAGQPEVFHPVLYGAEGFFGQSPDGILRQVQLDCKTITAVV